MKFEKQISNFVNEGLGQFCEHSSIYKIKVDRGKLLTGTMKIIDFQGAKNVPFFSRSTLILNMKMRTDLTLNNTIELDLGLYQANRNLFISIIS